MRNIYGHDPDDLPYRFQRVAPIAVSPHDADMVYHGSQYLHRTMDGGRTWQQISPDLTARDPATQMPSGMPINRDITGEEYHSTLYAIAESPVQRGVIWVGANDGPIHVSRDDGANWAEVTPPELGPHGRVQTVEPSPHQAGKAYVAVLRYQLGDFAPYIFRTDDYGESWARLTPGDNGIPGDHPTRVVREDPDREGLLYAGTEFGMFVSFDDGGPWQPFQQNLPVTPVTDLKVYRQDLVLSTMGRGFWVMDDITPLHEASEIVSDAHLFTPRPAYRVRAGGFGSGDTPAAEPRYPEEGAVLNYYLAQRATGPVTIEVLDRRGAVVQRFSSTDAAPEIRELQEMRAPVRERIGGPRLSVEPGMHRITWNLSTFAPEGRQSSRSSGPMVPPGLYRVRLSAERTVQARDLEIRMDPRVTAEGITAQDVTDQYVLALEVGDALGEARAAASELERVGDETPLGGRLAEIHRAMVTEDRQDYPTPMLIDQLSYLYSNLNSADQPPGRDAYEQYERLRAELDGFLREIRTLTGWETTSHP